MSNALHPVLLPTSFSHIVLRNRAVVAPMTRVSTAGDGVPTSEMHEYYTSFAQGGFGLVITEGTYTDLAYSQGYENQPGLVTDAQADAWRQIVDSVHAAGGKIFVQLMHAGAISQGNRHRTTTVAPSAIQPKDEMMSIYGGRGPYAMPRSMNPVDLREAIDGFAGSAARARAIGFDGAEIHGANGYLLDQFLTTYTNTRTDLYGGDVRNRIRFTEDVVRAVVEASGGAGSGFVVGVRLSESKVNDKTYVWPGGAEDGRTIFSVLAQAGVSYIHMAAEGRDFGSSARLRGGVSMTRLAKQVAHVPVIANGSLHHPEQAARVLEEGEADLVALGRGAMANPDWPNRLARGVPFDPFDPGFIRPSASLQNTANHRITMLTQRGDLDALAG